MSKHAKYRDAATGNYVSREYAEVNPETTVREVDKGCAITVRNLSGLPVRVVEEMIDGQRALNIYTDYEPAGPDREVAGGCQATDEAET